MTTIFVPKLKLELLAQLYVLLVTCVCMCSIFNRFKHLYTNILISLLINPFSGSGQSLDLNLEMSPTDFADGAKGTDDFGSLSFQNHLKDIPDVRESRVSQILLQYLIRFFAKASLLDTRCHQHKVIQIEESSPSAIMGTPLPLGQVYTPGLPSFRSGVNSSLLPVYEVCQRTLCCCRCTASLNC